MNGSNIHRHRPPHAGSPAHHHAGSPPADPPHAGSAHDFEVPGLVTYTTKQADVNCIVLDSPAYFSQTVTFSLGLFKQKQRVSLTQGPCVRNPKCQHPIRICSERQISQNRQELLQSVTSFGLAVWRCVMIVSPRNRS